MRLNPSQPHAAVYGTPGVRFQQNGRYFRDDGEEVDGDPEREAEIVELRDLLADPSTDMATKRGIRERLRRISPGEFDEPAPMAVEPAKAPNGWSEDDLRRPENKTLKAQLDVYGESWTTRKAALEFLEKGRA